MRIGEKRTGSWKTEPWGQSWCGREGANSETEVVQRSPDLFSAALESGSWWSKGAAMRGKRFHEGHVTTQVKSTESLKGVVSEKNGRRGMGDSKCRWSLWKSLSIKQSRKKGQLMMGEKQPSFVFKMGKVKTCWCVGGTDWVRWKAWWSRRREKIA